MFIFASNAWGYYDIEIPRKRIGQDSGYTGVKPITSEREKNKYLKYVRGLYGFIIVYISINQNVRKHS
jgi:hypothetical protein